MKRLICLLLAMIISCPMIYAQDNEQIVQIDEKVSEAAEFFSETGIFSVDENTDWSAPVTRSKAVRYLFEICGLIETVSTDGVTSFYDVPETHEDYNYIMAARAANLVSGYADNTFRPESYISVTDFITMTVCVLGYKQDADFKGGYPSGYVQTAANLELYKNVSNVGAELSMGDMIKVLRNAVEVPLYVQTLVGQSSKIEKDDNRTILSQCYDIYSVKGVLKGNTLTSISGGTVSGEDLEIAQTYYHTDTHKYDCYLGYNVELWYRDADGDIYETLYVKPSVRTKEIQLQADDITGYDAQKLYYSSDNKNNKNIRLDSAFKIVYNGKILQDYILNYNDANCVFRQPNGTMTFVDSESDGNYDLVCIETYTDLVISKVSTADNNTKLKIFAQYGVSTVEVDLNNDNLRVEGIGADGTVYNGEELVSLTAGNVVSIYADIFETVAGRRSVSKDASYIRVAESDKSITGKLSSIGEDERGITYEIDGNRYYLSESNYLEENRPKIGDVRTFKLNSFDEIVACSDKADEETGMQYGYLINAYVNESGDEIEMRMLLTDGTVSKFKSAQKLKLNNVRAKDFRKVIQELYTSASLISDNSENMSQVVKFRKNSNGEITELETIIDNEQHDDRLSLDSRRMNAMARTKGNIFTSGPWQNITMEDGRESGTARGFYYLPKVIFRVPDELKSDDRFYSTIKLEDEKYYDAEAWDIGKDLMPEVMVCYTSGADVKIGHVYMVKKYYSAVYDDEGYDVLCVNNGVTDMEFRIERMDDSPESMEQYNKLMSLKKGDVVELYGDENDGIVRRAELLLGIDSLPDITINTAVNTETSRIQFMELYYSEGRYLVTQRGDIVSGMRREEQYPWYWSNDSALMHGAILYDATNSAEKPEIRAATLDDLRPAYTYGEKSSKVFTLEGYCQPQFIVIYNGI